MSTKIYAISYQLVWVRLRPWVLDACGPGLTCVLGPLGPWGHLRPGVTCALGPLLHPSLHFLGYRARGVRTIPIFKNQKPRFRGSADEPADPWATMSICSMPFSKDTIDKLTKMPLIMVTKKGFTILPSLETSTYGLYGALGHIHHFLLSGI